MERYEFKDGSSHKFWEVAVEAETLIVRFGKIGTAGQTKEKAFDSAAAAEKEKAKLVKEKTQKGYVAAGASDTPAPAVVNKTPLKAENAPEDLQTTVAPPSRPAPITRTALVGGDRIVKDTPLPTRLRPEKARSADDSWAAFAQILSAKAPSGGTWPEELVKAGPPNALTAAETAQQFLNLQKVVEQSLGYRSMKEDGRPAVVSLCRHYAHWVVSARGAPFAMEVAHAILRPQQPSRIHYAAGAWSLAPLIALRSAISATPANDYDAALQQCLDRRSGSWAEDAYIAFVLADDRPEQHALQMLSVLEDAASQGVEVGAQLVLAPLIAESPGPTAWRVTRSYFMYFVYLFASAGEIAVTAEAAAAARGDSPLPTLDWLLHYATDDDRTTIASAILDTRDEDALALLAPHLHEKTVRAALDHATETYPDWTFQRMLASLSSGRAEPALRARAMKVIETYGAETTREWASVLGGRGESYYESLVAAGAQPIARDKDLPSFLREPPWRAKKKTLDDLVVQIEPKDSALQFKSGPVSDPPPWAKASILDSPAALIAFIQGVEKELAGNQWSRAPAPSAPLPELSASEQDVLAWLSRRFDELASSAPRYAWGRYSNLISVAHLQPEGLALLLWNKPAAMQLPYGLDWLQAVRSMLSRYGERALPGLVKNVEADPTALLPCVQEVDTPALAPVAARAFMKLKKARAHGRAWLKAHPRAALLNLIPAAVGRPGEARDAAEYAVRFYQSENPEVLATVIAEYANIAPQLSEAIAQVLSRDPYSRTPSKVAKPPSWLTVSSLSRPQLKAGGALSDEAMTATVEMLSFINPADVYPGVPALRQACTEDSIARFAWDLFSAWLAEGAPSKEGWAFRAVGWFGDDECARQLTRLVRKWPGESAHARAVTGLDVLADIGTDVALMNLNGIAEKVKFKGLQDRAREKIAAIAETRELSAEELADRLAPDLDLDERGGLDLDFGPRIFRAGFDEFLKPWVKDGSGARLKDLPKPVKSDDAEKSKEASAKWTALKKDARAIASLQLARLETMLATGRRSKPDVFQTFFASHPLIRHLAQRLVWGAYDTDAIDAAPTLYFRVGEDLSFTDADDNPVVINVGADASGLIGLAHPLHMTAEDQAKWGALFGDYEIAQPFPQLGREIYALTEAEKAADALTRFDGREVESKRLRGMAARGWRTGQPQDAGAILWLERSVTLSNGEKAPAMLNFEEGLYAGAASEEPQMQKLREITLDQSSYYRRQSAHRFGELDAVTASEILRSVTLLVEAQGA